MLVSLKARDVAGNEYWTVAERVFIRLSGETAPRNIGTLTYQEGRGRMVFFKRFDPNEHVFVKLSAIGIARLIVDRMSDDDELIFEDKKSGSRFFISVAMARSVGTYNREHGFEEQLFIPLAKMAREQHRVKEEV